MRIDFIKLMNEQVKTLDGTPPKRKDTEFSYAAEILITKSELTDKNRRVFTLQQQVDETKTESEYQLRLKDNKYIEEGRLAKKKFNAELNAKKEVTQRLEADITSIKKEFTDEMSHVMQQHDRDMAEVAEQFKSKLIIEYQKFDNLNDKYIALKRSYEKQMQAMENNQKKELKYVSL